MAKQQIRQYAFTPGTINTSGRIEIPGKWDLNQLTLITNATRNVILYNFADPQYAGTTITFNRSNSTNFPTAIQNGDGTTTITLVSNTVGHSSTDGIQIFIERLEQITRPWPMGTDAFERQRVANPQSMLDADFEYGLQPTKWQTIDLVRGTPSVYEIPGSDQLISTMITDASGGGSNPTIESLITVTTVNPHLITTGTIVTVTNLDQSISGYARAQGIMLVQTVTSPYVFTYYAKGQVGTVASTRLDTTYTTLRKGNFYTSSQQIPTYSVSGSGASTTGTITLTFTNNHGYVAGTGITSVITSDNGSNNHTLCQGAFYILTVPTPTTLTFQARNVGTITGTPVGSIYARPDAFYVHRPFDGGVSLGAGGPNYGSSAIRMTKKYIRYQSGKSINYNTAALFAPNYDIRSVTATNITVASTITVVTDNFDHGLQAGSTVQINGIATSGYNGVYPVLNIVDERTFQIQSTSTLGTSTAVLSTPSYINHISWQGSTIRAGTFDDQNGIFWQFDGIQMAVGMRSGIFQIAGTANLTPGSTLFTGNNTRWADQLIAGDRIVVKGMTHLVTAISSSTWMYINPPYRGSTTSNSTIVTKIIDTLIPQSQWNYDRCDGSNGPFNPSGYNLLPWKVQMVGLQWTWYGAGFIDWMLRGPDGNYMTVHRMKNSNVNYAAYMRSGNQASRYEVINEGARSSLVNNIGTTDTAMTLTDITYFPPSGIVLIDNEQIAYTSKSTSTGQGQLLGLTRSAVNNYFVAGSYRSFTAGSAAVHSAGTGTISIGISATPTVTHWGSAYLQDGGFDSDRGYIFNYPSANITVSTVKKTAFAIRLAPSVSNAVTGDLGVRDLINRAQLLLQGIENTVGGGSGGQQAVVIEGVLNPSNYPNTVTNITWYNLQGSVAGGNIQGSGQPSFTQIASTNNIQFDGTATYSTTLSSSATINSTVLSVASTASMAIGDAIVTTVAAATGGTGIAGNSLIQSIGAGTITLTQPVLSVITSATSITGYRNQWAIPGETIFSFISSPANKDSLDLSPLKELTNTPLGGRGCYPNGPDTLFINVYLTSGPPLQTNLVLRWGEAQA